MVGVKEERVNLRMGRGVSVEQNPAALLHWKRSNNRLHIVCMLPQHCDVRSRLHRFA